MPETRPATFWKVSKRQFTQDFYGETAETAAALAETDFISEIYSGITLPTRATTGSAGYDFYLPYAVTFDNTPRVIQTGVRVKLDPGWVLLLLPRSGLGFKYGMRLRNTVGVIDSDYFNAKNEGHIMASVVSDEPFTLKAGDRFLQGIIMPYGVAANDTTLMKQRDGGFGSTGGTLN